MEPIFGLYLEHNFYNNFGEMKGKPFTRWNPLPIGDISLSIQVPSFYNLHKDPIISSIVETSELQWTRPKSDPVRIDCNL